MKGVSISGSNEYHSNFTVNASVQMTIPSCSGVASDHDYSEGKFVSAYLNSRISGNLRAARAELRDCAGGTATINI